MSLGSRFHSPHFFLGSRIFGTIETTATRKETVYVPFKNKAQSNLIYFYASFVFILVVPMTSATRRKFVSEDFVCPFHGPLTNA